MITDEIHASRTGSIVEECRDPLVCTRYLIQPWPANADLLAIGGRAASHCRSGRVIHRQVCGQPGTVGSSRGTKTNRIVRLIPDLVVLYNAGENLIHVCNQFAGELTPCVYVSGGRVVPRR